MDENIHDRSSISKSENKAIAPIGASSNGPIPYDAEWDAATVQTAFDESRRLYAMCPEWSDALDKKAVTVFTVATAAAGVIPALIGVKDVSPLRIVALCAGAVAYVAAVVCCYRAFRPRKIMLGPEPKQLLTPNWLNRTPKSYQYWRIRYIAEAFEANQGKLEDKGRALSRALIATGLEVLVLAAVRFL